MAKLFWGLFKAARPRQWIKNLALFAGLVFSGQLDNPQSLSITIQSFITFCGLSSAVYLLNDVFDAERDRSHPFKKNRPIASGVVPENLAVITSLILLIFFLPLAFSITPSLFYAGVAFVLLQLFYSAYFKSVMLLDVMFIAAGFVLRVYAGIWAIDAHLNVWFLLCIISFSLFLAIGKRRSELTLMAQKDIAAKHRETLLHYPETLLDILTAMFANSTWLTYALFAFQQAPVLIKTTLWNITFLTIPFAEAKYLMATVPLAIYGVMRYLYIIYEKKEGESPEKVLLTDKPILATVIAWGLMLFIIIYYFGGY